MDSDVSDVLTNSFLYVFDLWLWIFYLPEQQIDEYLKVKGSDLEQEIAADIILRILDVMLKSEFSLNSQLVSESFIQLVDNIYVNK